MDDTNSSGKLETSRVGYCNPPTHSRFQKGKSGNPKGRPKGTLNIATVLERTLREKVVINENGSRRTVTKLEAAFKQLTNKAAAGELKALQLLAALVRSVERQSTQHNEIIGANKQEFELVVTYARPVANVIDVRPERALDPSPESPTKMIAERAAGAVANTEPPWCL